jgi:hypothetical protein
MDDSDRLHSWLHHHDDDLRLPSVLRYLALLFLGTFVFSEGTPVGSSATQYRSCVVVPVWSFMCGRSCVVVHVFWRLTMVLEPSQGGTDARFPTLLNTRPAPEDTLLLLLGPL